MGEVGEQDDPFRKREAEAASHFLIKRARNSRKGLGGHRRILPTQPGHQDQSSRLTHLPFWGAY